jgi:hypothetical protein
MHCGVMFLFFFDENPHVVFLIGLRIAQTHLCSILVIGLKVVVRFEESNRIHRIFALKSPVQGMEAHNDVFWSKIYSKL